MPLAVLEQAHSMSVPGRVVFGEQRQAPAFSQLLPLYWVEPRPEKILGEIGCSCDADKPLYARGSGERDEQHDPPAHARAHEDLPPLRQRIDHRNCIFRPAPDRADRRLTARSTAAKMVEAHKGLSSAAAIIFEIQCLVPAHVGMEATQKDNSGGFSDEPVVGNCCSITAC